MPYATAVEFEVRYGTEAYTVQADRTLDGVAEVPAIDQVLESASSLIDSFIVMAFELPLPDPTPASLRHACIEIAAHMLSRDQGTWSKEKRRRYEDVIEWLKMVAAGEVGLGDPDADDQSIKDAVKIEFDDPVWTRGSYIL